MRDYILEKGISLDYIKTLKIADLKAIYVLLDVRRFIKNGYC